MGALLFQLFLLEALGAESQTGGLLLVAVLPVVVAAGAAVGPLTARAFSIFVLQST